MFFDSFPIFWIFKPEDAALESRNFNLDHEHALTQALSRPHHGTRVS